MRKLLFCIITVFLATVVQAKEKYHEVSSIKQSKHFGNVSKLWKDAEEKLTVNDFIGEELPPNSFSKEESIPYIGFTSDTYWQYIKFKNSSNSVQNVYVELAHSVTDDVTLYLYDENYFFVDSIHSGDGVAYNKRLIDTREIVFLINFPANSKRIFIVKSNSGGSVLKMTVKVSEFKYYTSFGSLENFFLGAYYGFFILVIIMFSFFFFILKESLYGYFVLYVIVLWFFQFNLDGYAFQYLWPNSIVWERHAIVVLGSLSLISLWLYIKRFFGVVSINYRYKIVSNIIIFLILINLIFALTEGFLFQLSYPIVNALALVLAVYSLVGIITLNVQGAKIELAFTLAFVSLVMGAVVFVLSNLNIVKSDFLSANAIKIGSFFEIMLLSVAMPLRYRNVQIEKNRAKNETLIQLEKVNDYKSKQNEELELEVKERLKEIVRKNKNLSSTNRKIIDSINYAKSLQDALLPSINKYKNKFKSFAVLNIPKDIVSGDFYWMEETDSHLFFVVADCTGHGVPGAMVSIIGLNGLNRCVNEFGLTDAGEILNKLREIVISNLSKSGTEVNDGMDISLCIWDKKSSLNYAGAFNPLHIFRNGELIITEGDKQPIGNFVNTAKFKSHKIDLEKDDVIFIYSDGYSDQFGGEKGKKLMKVRFRKLLVEGASLSDEKWERFLRSRFEKWRGKNEQIDDVCVMRITL